MKKITICTILIIISFYSNAQNKLEIEFKTGEDDLRGIGTTEFSPDVVIKMVNKPEVLKRAINGNATWPKNSIRKVSIPLDTSINIGDLLGMELVRMHSNSSSPTTKSPDNWDLNKVTVTATFKKNGQTTKYELLQTFENRNGMPYRMTYENSETPKRFNFNRNPILLSGTSNWIDKFPPPQKTSFTANFGIGGDDLRGGRDNAKIVLTFKNSNQKIIFNNVNKNVQWNNFTEYTAYNDVKSLPNFTVNDIATVELWHTGGGGMGADNWDIDKFKLTVTINGQSKELVDKTGTPLHRFTGDTRRKTFNVE